MAAGWRVASERRPDGNLSRELEMTRLVADLGGTRARFALAEPEGRLSAQAEFEAAAYASPLDAARAFLAMAAPGQRPRQAVFAVAAPVAGDEVQFTNSAWRLSATALRRELGLAQARLINDFEAVAWALPRLRAEHVRKLCGGEADADAPRAAIGPGTGLGVAGLAPAGDGWTVLPSEGGHCSFAPQDEMDAQIWRILRRQFGHVSDERLASGPGLVNLYRALAEIRGEAAAVLRPDEVADRGASGSDPVCAEAVRRFSAALGSAAGDLALTLGARGGVYIGGGVVPRLASAFDVGLFRERFVAKGRLRPYLEPIPVFLIKHSQPALLGAAHARI